MFIGGLIGFILDNTIPGNLYNIFYNVCISGGSEGTMGGSPPPPFGDFHPTN